VVSESWFRTGSRNRRLEVDLVYDIAYDIEYIPLPLTDFVRRSVKR
jgi:hypothetical protein